MICLDTNIILRFILNNDPDLSPKARLIIEKIQSDKIKVYLPMLAVSEIVFTLERSYRLPKEEIVKSLLTIFSLPSLNVENREQIEEAFRDYLEKNVNFPDAFYIALMKKKRIKKIYSFDRDFDKFPKIQRLED